MNIQILRVFLCLVVAVNSPMTHADDNPDKFLGPRDIRGLKSAIEGYIKHRDSIFRYGNWYGPGWWGGATDAKQPGNEPPIDSLDAIAQKHDFGYQVAEQQGKIYGVSEEKRLKGIADYIAVRDAKALPENPKEWAKPPADLSKASRYRDRMITGFAYEGPAYEGIAITGKGLDWATSPIENWELDKSHQLNADDLEKQVARLQKNWGSKNLTPATNPEKSEHTETPDKNTDKSEKTDKAEQEPTDKNSPESDKTNKTDFTTTQPNNAEQTTDKSNTTSTTNSGSNEQQGTSDKKTDAELQTQQADPKELENDPDYIELMRLTNEMMGLANQAMAQANAGKIPSNSLVNKITSLQPRISALSKRIETRYGKKYLGENKTNNKNNKDQQNATGDRGGTVYNKDGSKDVLHYEKDPDGKEVAVWTTYDKNGQVIKKRREK